ncbi:MAG: [FeFe] hydrogenase, group A [Christensenellales bacterium]|jgi:NADH-quinone oxidoreductase subunit G
MLNTDNYMIIDGIPVEIEDEKNMLQLVRKAGIKLPTFCYHSELSIYGACRMCMVENEWGGLDAACSTPPKAGAAVKTNTQRLRKYRKMILELLLSNHCRDCTTCSNNGKCKLQDLAERFNITGVRFPNTAPVPEVDDSSICIVRDHSKCILCGDCVRMCDEVQNVGAIDFAHRGSNMRISTAFDIPLAESNCVGCGQCAVVCPTGAIVVQDDSEKVLAQIDDENVKVTVQIAPAVRVAMGKELGFDEGENAMGKIVAALRRLGFDEVFDTSTGADLTVLEESKELIQRLKEGKDLPLFTSCCPAWVHYCEKNHPELLKNVSTCRSPMQMLAATVKEQYAPSSRKHVHVAVMPCTAKKFEAARSEFQKDGIPMVDFVLTTQELIRMIREAGIQFTDLEPEAIDMPFGTITGAGVIFGATGGVTEAVLRRLASQKDPTTLMAISLKGVRGLEGTKEMCVPYDGGEAKIAIVSGLGNASRLIERIQQGAHYDFVEVMACPNGCINGAGQPYVKASGKQARAKGLYAVDKLCSIRRSEENPLVMSLYSGLLKGKVHELLHVEYDQSGKEEHV